MFGLQERLVSDMAIISRAKMRGKALDYDCKKAKISTNESGPQDNRLFCYGLIDCSTDDYLKKCIECGAFRISHLRERMFDRDSYSRNFQAVTPAKAGVP